MEQKRKIWIIARDSEGPIIDTCEGSCEEYLKNKYYSCGYKGKLVSTIVFMPLDKHPSDYIGNCYRDASRPFDPLEAKIRKIIQEELKYDRN